MPRCAYETEQASVARLDRIRNALIGSRYSIHDLSRCRGDGDNNLARMNMPLELGMAMAMDGSETGHEWLPMVPRGHLYKAFISDLSGFDPAEHDETVETVIPVVMRWLATRPHAIRAPRPSAVIDIFPDYCNEIAELRSDWGNCLPWTDFLSATIEIASKKEMVPDTS